MHALDSEVTYKLLEAIHEKHEVLIKNNNSNSRKTSSLIVTPLKIFVSVQTGRRYLFALNNRTRLINSYRLDYIVNVEKKEKSTEFNEYLKQLSEIQKHLWGVSINNNRKQTEHIEMVVYVGENEDYIVTRLEREKRCGKVEKLDESYYKFSADVMDSSEMIPWFRTFIGRITKLDISNKSVENIIKSDIQKMYELYLADMEK